jgi:hypothetical protein
VFQSGYAKEQRVQRYLRDVEKMLRNPKGCQVSGSNRDGYKSITFKVSVEQIGGEK